MRRAGLLLALVLMGCSAEVERPTVVRVYDGDTVTVRHEGREQSVRIMGLDTPEIGRNARCAAEEQLGQRARAELLKFLGAGRPEFRWFGDDRYGRRLAVVTVNGRDAADHLINMNLAVRYGGRGPRRNWCERTT
jgi:endonuclease YncB( thermonuclease family)